MNDVDHRLYRLVADLQSELASLKREVVKLKRPDEFDDGPFILTPGEQEAINSLVGGTVKICEGLYHEPVIEVEFYYDDTIHRHKKIGWYSIIHTQGGKYPSGKDYGFSVDMPLARLRIEGVGNTYNMATMRRRGLKVEIEAKAKFQFYEGVKDLYQNMKIELSNEIIGEIL